MTYYDANRSKAVKKIRDAATKLSTDGPFDPPEVSNDEAAPFIFSFTKGLTHNDRGLLSDTTGFEKFRDGTESPDPAVFTQAPLHIDDDTYHTATAADFAALPCRTSNYREWESPTAGHAYELQGPDPMAIAMPAAPKAGSFEFSAEIAEVYQMALCRDWGVSAFMSANLVDGLLDPSGNPLNATALGRIEKEQAKVTAAAERLSRFRWFKGDTEARDVTDPELQGRRRKGVPQSASNMFRGLGEDSWDTPFLSQFMVMGSKDCQRAFSDRASGQIKYGAQRIDQSVDIAVPEKDYMTNWREWVDVQNALNVRPLVGEKEFLQKGGKRARRPISRLRDLATYVHDDQLYQAYLNAALVMLAEGFGQDAGLPYHGAGDKTDSRWNQEPFALFGGPHILTLLTEVSGRALKAVRHQKFTIHRRMRPEAAGALFHTIYSGYNPNREFEAPGYTGFDETGPSDEFTARSQLGQSLATYTFPTGTGTDPELEGLLTEVRLHNAKMNGEDSKNLSIAKWLLPMAFPEGSPMHPAYGAGHATVAGACVTLLKAMFAMVDPDDSTKPVYLVERGQKALVPDCGTSAADKTIDLLGLPVAEGLTLEGELNKLIWNVSNARNIAGVHYFTDYIESALLGEAITLGILREQMLTYEPLEQVSVTVPLLVCRTLPAALIENGPIGAGEKVEAVRINNNGQLESVKPTPGR